MGRPKKSTGIKTKAIAETVQAAVSTETKANDLDVIARQGLAQTLSPRDAYELNVHVRKGVDGIADQCAKAKVRFFSRRSNTEILDGDVVRLYRRPNRFQNTHTFVRDSIVWWYLEGEYATWKRFEPGTSRPFALEVLDPGRLNAMPSAARSLETLDYWYYNSPFEFRTQGDNYGNNTVNAYIKIAVQDLAFASNFNSNTKLRGLSPLVSGQLEVSTSYFAGKFNASFFQNGAHADLVFVFPKGTSKKVAKECVEQWSAKHGVYNNRGFGVTGIIADQIQIQDLSKNNKEGQFLQLSQYDDEKISGLLGVPPSVAGFLSKTRFDTIDVELEAFAENTLLPVMYGWSELHQAQVVDAHFKNTSFSKKRELSLRPNMKKVLERAFDERPDSDIVILLDPDSLPIVNKLQLKKFELLQQIRESADLSVNEAAEMIGLELPYRPERDQIWVPNARERIDQEAQDQQQEQAEQQEEQREEVEEAEDGSEAEQVKALNKTIREYRALVLEAVAQGKSFDKRAALKLFQGNERMTLSVHRDFLGVRQLLKADDAVAECKKYLNQKYRKSAVKELV